MGEWLLRPSTLSRMTTRPTWTTSRRTLTSSSPSNAENKPAQPSSQPKSEPAQASEAQPKQDPFSGLLGSKPRYQASESQQQTTQSIDSLFASTNDSRFTRKSRTGYASRNVDSADQFSAAQRTFGSEFTKGVRTQRKPLDFGAMLSPEGLAANVAQPAKPVMIPESKKVYPRLNASYGRVVELDETRGRDLVRGISMLGSLMTRNKVRSDFNKQKFHERPGLKRKRLNSERWRARFKLGFKQVTSRVTELTRKGW